MPERTLHLSPSAHHRYLLQQIQPTHRYEGGDVTAWQDTLRPIVRKLVGDVPQSQEPLNVRSLWQRDHALGSIEKVVFTSEPFCDVPAYVCLPNDVSPPYTFMVCLQGHSTGMHNSIGVQQDDEAQPLNVQGDRDFAIGCLRQGVAALCIEQRSFGERREQLQEQVSSQGCHDATMHALLLGRTLIGERVYDVDRGIDYLAQRGDADMNRIGVMGNSGGGTIALFAAALLDRVAFAMPSCYFSTFKDSLLSIYHCADNYIPGLFKVAEMSDVMGLFAPKPVVIVSGQDDPIFPISAAQAAFAELQAIYRAAGVEEQCRFVVGQGGHRFYADDAWPVLMELLEQSKYF